MTRAWVAMDQDERRVAVKRFIFDYKTVAKQRPTAAIIAHALGTTRGAISGFCYREGIALSQDRGRLSVSERIIQESANKHLERAKRTRTSGEFGAVNWADLECVDVVKCVGLRLEWIEVHVEEAAPDSQLADWLHRALCDEFGTCRLFVRTEW